MVVQAEGVKENKVPVLVHIEPEYKVALKAYAEKEGISISQAGAKAIRHLLSDSVCQS